MSATFSPADGEVILWQGRPAPRCYVFRLWKQALAGGLLFLVSSFWLMLGWQLQQDGYPTWILLLPLSVVAGSFFFGPWQIVRARLQWPRIFYAMTDQRLCDNLGRELALSACTQLKVKRFGPHLASLRFSAQDGGAVIFYCLEQPEILIGLVETHCLQLKN